MMNIGSIKKSVSKKTKMSSFILALLLISKLVISWLANYLNISNPGLIVMGTIWILAFSYMVIFHDYKWLNTKSFSFIFIIGCALLSSNFFGGVHIKDINLLFLQYCLIGFIVGQFECDIAITLKMVAYLLLILLVPIYQMLKHDLTERWQQDITMDLTYFLLPIVMASIGHCFFYKKNSNIFIKLSYILAFFLSGLVVLFGTRGAILSLVVFIVLMYINTPKEESKRTTRKIFIICCLLIIGLFYEQILYLFNQLLLRVDIRFEGLEKTLSLMQNDNISNGRNEIYKLALQGFLDSPLWGHGIGSFADNFPQHGFPHNSILQFLYEGGIVFGFLFIAIIIAGIKIIFKNNEKGDNKVINILFFSLAFIPSLFSNEPWATPLLWVWFGIVLKYKNLNKVNK